MSNKVVLASASVAALFSLVQSKDDRRKIAGHAKERQTENYDRDYLEAFRRTMRSRAGCRAKNEVNGSDDHAGTMGQRIHF